MAQGTCTTVGCHGPAICKGMCKSCYMKARRDRLAQEQCILCDRPRSTVSGLCVPHSQRERDYGDALAGPPLRKQRTEGEHTGTTSEYHLNHRMVRKARGPAWQHPCEHCGQAAVDWATIHGKSGDQPDHYMPLCRSCHCKYDEAAAHLPDNTGSKRTPEQRERMRQAALNRSPESRERYRQAALRREARKRGEVIENGQQDQADGRRVG